MHRTITTPGNIFLAPGSEYIIYPDHIRILVTMLLARYYAILSTYNMFQNWPCAYKNKWLIVYLHCTVRLAFDYQNREAVLLANASNVFNSLNRLTALHNVQRLCPQLATILINTYHPLTDLFGGDEVLLFQKVTHSLCLYAYACHHSPNQTTGRREHSGVVCWW